MLDVKAEATRKVGPFPVWAYAVGGGLLFIYVMRHGGGYAAVADEHQDPGRKAGGRVAPDPVEPVGPGSGRGRRRSRGGDRNSGGRSTGGAFGFGGIDALHWSSWGGPGPWEDYPLQSYWPGIDITPPATDPGGGGAPPPGGGSGLGSRALAAGMEYVGCPYKWAGTSCHPGIDCSGLTMQAWGAVGVKLPHFSGAQFLRGRPVARGQWIEGDLLFFFHPIHHVAMYAGNDRILTANHPGQPVHVEALGSWLKFYAGARRPG